MHETTRIKRTTKRRYSVGPRPGGSSEVATSPASTVSTLMDGLPAGANADDATKDEKTILQGIAHGGEGYGNEYGSGPGAANGDANTSASPAVPGDSASPAASAMSTRVKHPTGGA